MRQLEALGNGISLGQIMSLNYYFRLDIEDVQNFLYFYWNRRIITYPKPRQQNNKSVQE